MNFDALSELHEFVGTWRLNHELTRAEETYILSYYLSQRLDVTRALEAIAALPPTYTSDPDNPFGVKIVPLTHPDLDYD